MIKRYRLPIYGMLLSKDPPRGDLNNPVQPISLYDLPDAPEEVMRGKYTDTPVEYNFDEGWCEIELDADEAVHTWLEAQLLDKKRIESVKVAKGLTLDINKVKVE